MQAQSSVSAATAERRAPKRTLAGPKLMVDPPPLPQPILRPHDGRTMEMIWRRSMPAAIDRLRLREEAFQDVIADGVILLVERGMCDARHHRELLVGIGQQFEELQEVGEARDAVVFAAHDQR